MTRNTKLPINPLAIQLPTVPHATTGAKKLQGAVLTRAGRKAHPYPSSPRRPYTKSTQTIALYPAMLAKSQGLLSDRNRSQLTTARITIITARTAAPTSRDTKSIFGGCIRISPPIAVGRFKTTEVCDHCVQRRVPSGSVSHSVTVTVPLGPGLAESC